MTWFDDNERKSFPLVGDDDGAVPQDILVDVLLHVPAATGSQVELTSIAVTALVVSVVFSVAGVPVAYATVENNADLVQATVPLVPIVTGVSGFVVLGSGIQRHRLNVTGTYKVLDACVISFPAVPTLPTLTAQGRELFGQVTLQAGPNVEITAEDVVIMGVGTRRAAVFRLAAAVSGEPVGTAYRSAEANLTLPAVRLINGIPPPLQIAVVTVKELPTEASVTVAEDIPDHAIDLVDDGEPCA